MTALRVVIVDDQAMVRAGFRMILEAEPGLDVIGEATNGVEAVQLVRQARPDVVLMDVRMPEMDGIEATRLICADRRAANGNGGRDSHLPAVLVLTTFDLDDYVHAALRAGASGFLLKDATPEELVNAIRVVAGGEALLAPSVTRRLIEELHRQPAPQTRELPGLDLLTERELEVLRLVARGLSNAEIASTLYLGEATVKTHVGRVLMKLGVRDRVQAVVAAYEAGVVVPGPDQT